MTLLRTILADILAGTNQRGCTGKLLGSQKTQGIPHDYRRPGCVFRVRQFAVKNRKCGQSEICFGCTFFCFLKLFFKI